MDLYLVRHGEAKPETEDPECPLTDRGAEVVRRMAAWAAQVGVGVSQIRHSGKKRAEQTATLFAERLNPANGVIAAEGLKPLDDVRPVAGALRAEHEPLMLVGHLPFLSRLVSLLIVGNLESGVIGFNPTAIVCLSQEKGKWAPNWVTSPELLDRKDRP
jgi:phosphohistidine phosphatase